MLGWSQGGNNSRACERRPQRVHRHQLLWGQPGHCSRPHMFEWFTAGMREVTTYGSHSISHFIFLQSRVCLVREVLKLQYLCQVQRCSLFPSPELWEGSLKKVSAYEKNVWKEMYFLNQCLPVGDTFLNEHTNSFFHDFLVQFLLSKMKLAEKHILWV